MDSIGYYDKNSKKFYHRTINADMQEIYQLFLSHIPEKGRVLDAGCGVGRDAGFFLNQGYDVVAFDGSLEMVKMAAKYIEKVVLHMRFQEISFASEFDAIWANASLLHIPYEDLRQVMSDFHRALRPSGILYASFKYGVGMRQSEDRFFFDMNEATIEPFLKALFEPIIIWKSDDTRSQVAPSPDRSWLNFIARRI